MLDVSTASPTRAATTSTALVTALAADVEVRVWPPEEVWTVARALDTAGLAWEAALPDESGLPGSLVLHAGAAAEELLPRVLAALELPSVAPLGYLPADDSGTCRRLPGEEPTGRERVVFVELHECTVSGGWQVRAFGAAAALRRLHAATRRLTSSPADSPTGRESLTLALPGRPEAVADLVAHLDDAGLDGHLRVLRRRSTC